MGKKPKSRHTGASRASVGLADHELLLHQYRGTLNKGVFFELCVLKLVEHLLQSGGLGFLPTAAHVFYRKRYPSNSGEGSFQADVSVEVYRPSKPDPMIILLWDCKNHARKIRRAEVQKFFSDLQEIGASRVKGILATPTGLSRWARGFARKHGIGVWQIQMPTGWEVLDVNALEQASTSETLESFEPIGGLAVGCLALGSSIARSISLSNRYRGPY
jgi:hypothetical protein